MLHAASQHSRIVRVLLFGLAAALVVATIGGCTQRPPAAAYPTKAVDWVAPAAPGGGTDITLRAITPFLQSKWGQPVNVVNKPGGGTVPGTISVVQAAPDGYNMLGTAAIAYLNIAIQKGNPYQVDSLKWVARIVLSPIVFVVKGDSKYNTLKELADAIKADPTKFRYGSSGVTGPSTVAISQLADAVGVDANKLDRVPFDGGAPAVMAVAGGHVDLAAQNLSEVLGLVTGGKLKALAITTDQRNKELPNVPTTREAGFGSVTFVAHFGVAGPAKLPDDIVKKWEDIIVEAVKDRAVLAGLEKAGVIPSYMSSKDYAAWIQSETKTATAIAEKLGIRK